MWPRVAGLMSMNATVRSSSATICAGSSPATILQKMQSGSLTRGSLPVALAAQRPLRERRSRPPACRDLPGEARLLELGQDPPSSGPGCSPSARASSSPRTGGRGGSACHASASPSSCAGELEVLGDRLLRARRRGSPAGRRRSARSRRPAPARSRAGSGRSRAGDSGISCTRKPSRRWWRASAATCSASRSLARSRRRISPRCSRAGCVVADERDPPLGGDAARLRLGDVVQQRAEAQRLPRVSSLASGSASSACDGRGVRAEHRAPGRARARSSRRAPPACGRGRRGGGNGSARPRAAARARAAPPAVTPSASISSRPSQRAVGAR